MFFQKFHIILLGVCVTVHQESESIVSSTSTVKLVQLPSIPLRKNGRKCLSVFLTVSGNLDGLIMIQFSTS